MVNIGVSELILVSAVLLFLTLVMAGVAIFLLRRR